jgi:glutathione synthase/RimK-type ligase-like ATP-grasp enzyme
MLDVIIATQDPLPEPDHDEDVLARALDDAGLTHALHPWNRGPAPDARVCLIRSTWGYHHDVDGFVRWCASAAQRMTLLNPLPVIEWNVHKRYLLELQQAGVPVVPMSILPRERASELVMWLDAFGEGDVVVKPAVSAGSWQTWRVHIDDAEPYCRQILEHRDVMLQPYMRTIETHPERSLVFIDGEYSHTMHKSPRFADGEERVTGPHPCTDADLELAKRALACIPHQLLYARVDLFTGMDGRPCVSELELVEPSLFLQQMPSAASRRAGALARIVAGRG